MFHTGSNNGMHTLYETEETRRYRSQFKGPVVLRAGSWIPAVEAGQ